MNLLHYLASDAWNLRRASLNGGQSDEPALSLGHQTSIQTIGYFQPTMLHRHKNPKNIKHC